MWTKLARLRDRISGFYGLGRALRIAAWTSGIALAALFLVRNNYQSDARILPSSQSGTGALGALADMAGLSGVGGQSGDDQSYEDIIKSYWLEERLLNTQFEFHTHSWAFGEWKPQRMTLYQYLDKKNMDSAMDSLANVVLLTRDFKTQLLTVSAVTQSKDLSQQVAHRTVDLLNEFLVAKLKVKGANRAAFSKERLAEAKAEQAKAEEEFRNFLENNRTYPNSPDPTVRLRGNHLETELKMRQQITSTLAMNLEQALLDQSNNQPVLNVLDYGNLPENKSWPSRVKLTLIIFLLTTFAAWGWSNRREIRLWLFPGTEA